jgi:hypothetical protein
LLVSLLLAPASGQETPELYNLQLRLSNSSGVPLNTSGAVVLSVYATAEAVTPVYTETHQVTAVDGVVNIVMGSVTPIPLSLFEGSAERWLGIKLASDPEMLPRRRMMSVPYAQRANSAGHADDVLGADINPNTITVNGNQIVDATGTWVGPGGVQGPAGPTGPAGANGSDGAAGAVGPAGPTGLTGLTGTAGADGSDGAAGSVGPTGPAGSNGSDGAVGPAGPTGLIGLTGTAGADGSDGAAGPVGPTGPAGSNGSDGAVGPAGPTGAAGAAGPVGSTGPAGANGAVGPTGLAGAAGADGSDGAAGPVGPTGTAGSNGATGSTGPIGPLGVQGPTGPAGPTGPGASDKAGFDVYDNTGGQTFTTGTITVNLDTVRTDTSGSVFSLAADEVTVSTTATFLVMMRVSFDQPSGNSKSNARIFLERDSGAGFTEVDGFQAFTYVRNNAEGENTANAQGLLEVTSGDKFRIRAFREGGSSTIRTLADATGLTLLEL